MLHHVHLLAVHFVLYFTAGKAPWMGFIRTFSLRNCSALLLICVTGRITRTIRFVSASSVLTYHSLCIQTVLTDRKEKAVRPELLVYAAWAMKTIQSQSNFCQVSNGECSITGTAMCKWEFFLLENMEIWSKNICDEIRFHTSQMTSCKIHFWGNYDKMQDSICTHTKWPWNDLSRWTHHTFNKEDSQDTHIGLQAIFSIR